MIRSDLEEDAIRRELPDMPQNKGILRSRAMARTAIALGKRSKAEEDNSAW